MIKSVLANAVNIAVSQTRSIVNTAVDQKRNIVATSSFLIFGVDIFIPSDECQKNSNHQRI